MTRVVVNFANVGSTFGERVLKRKRERGERLFDYEGVRRCVRHLREKLGFLVIGVVFENWRASDEQMSSTDVFAVPRDIALLCESIEETPRLAGQQHRAADDEMTIKCAYNRNCRFLDNDNYADWRGAMADGKVKTWLQHCQEYMQMRYFFDVGLGTFDTLDGNIPGGPTP